MTEKKQRRASAATIKARALARVVHAQARWEQANATADAVARRAAQKAVIARKAFDDACSEYQRATNEPCPFVIRPENEGSADA